MTLTLAHTKDGDPAVSFAHLTLAMIPTSRPSSGSFRIQSAYPARDPSECKRTDFMGGSTFVDSEAEFLAHAQELADHYDNVASLAREPMEKQIPTPWQKSQTRTRYADGIEAVTCSGHGGILLSPEMNALVDPEWRNPQGAYEEDQCWAIVAFTFPDIFTQYEMKHAVQTLKNDFPSTYERLTGTILALEESESKRRHAFFEEHKDDLIVISAVRSKHDASKLLCSAAVGGRGVDPQRLPHTTSYLVDLDEYEAGWLPYGFIIDESRHPQCDADGSHSN